MKLEPNFEDFTFVYEFFFKEMDITFPLYDFEAQLLNFIHVAMSQYLDFPEVFSNSLSSVRHGTYC